MMSPQQLSALSRNSFLTHEGALFFDNLYKLNVPATEIATMMQTMWADQEAANRRQGQAADFM